MAQITPGYAVFSRDFCKVYSYTDALPDHQSGRSRSPQIPHLDNIVLVGIKKQVHTLCIHYIYTLYLKVFSELDQQDVITGGSHSQL